VFLAALTTFVSFISLCFSSVLPIKEFGVFSGFGVFASFIVAVTLIPALLIIRGPKTIKNREKSETRMDNFLADNLVAISQKRKTILFIASCFLIVSIYGLTKINADNAMVEYFKPDTGVAKSDRFIRENFGGSKVVSVVMQADSDEIILRPDTLMALDGLAAYLQKIPDVGKIMGFTDMVKRINQVINANSDPAGLERTEDYSSAFDDFGFGLFWDEDEYEEIEDTAAPTETEKIFTEREFFEILDRAASASNNMSAGDLVSELKRQVNYNGESYYEIPSDPARYGKDNDEELQGIISNYLFLLSGSISSYANNSLQPTAIKSTIQLRTLGMDDSREAINTIDRYLKIHTPPDVKVTIGGTTLVENSLNDLIVQSQLISVLISIICVFIIVAASNKSLIAGIIGIAPLSVSVLVNFAVMGFSGIKLNLGTSMVASVSVGIGIDYAIHYLEAFKREYRKSAGIKDSAFLWRSFNSSGKAIIINAVSVGAGFAVLLFSRFNMLVDLGLLIAITMFTSALVSITVLPALLVLLKPKFVTEQNPAESGSI
jgi:predicted RND superfamily exporter protein